MNQVHLEMQFRCGMHECELEGTPELVPTDQLPPHPAAGLTPQGWVLSTANMKCPASGLNPECFTTWSMHIGTTLDYITTIHTESESETIWLEAWG